MKRILLFFFLSFCSVFSAVAQQLPLQWTQGFRGHGLVADRIAAITTDNAGNSYVAGYAGAHHGAADAIAVKRNALGDTLWTYYYDGGGNNEDYATDIVVDNAGNTYITGYSSGTTPSVYDCFTAKILPSGAEAWVARYSPGGITQSYGNALVVDASGNVYVAGYSKPPSASNDWLVLKYNAAGVQQWVDVLNGPGNGDDMAMDIVLAPNGNPTVCGYTYSLIASGGINAFVKQYTPANGTVFTDTWTHPSYNGTDKAFGLGYNAAGDLLVGGTTMNGSSSNNDAFAIRYDAAGVQQWATIYSDATSAGDEYLRKVTVDQAGNVFFTGTDYQNGFTTCIYSNGSQGWRKKFMGSVPNGYEVFHAVAIDAASNVYVTGRNIYPGPDYYGNNGLTNMVITKYNLNGDSLWTYRCLDSVNASMGFAITCRDDKVYAGGFVTDTAYVNENLYTIVVDTSGNSVGEYIYNGKGDAVTLGQFVETDSNDNIYCAATIDRLSGKGFDVALIKYDPAGNLLWEKYYTSYGWNNDTLTGMQFDPSGNLILSISTDSSQTKSKYKLSLLKVDQNGTFLDTSWYGNTLTGSLLAKSMEIGANGSVALAVNSNTNGGMVVYFDNNMDWLWSAKIDSTVAAGTRSNSVAYFPNGDVGVGGYSSAAGVVAGLVQRYSATGSKLWSTAIDSASFYDEVRGIAIDALGDVAFVGASGGNTTYSALVGKIDGATGNELWHSVYNAASSTYETGVKVKFTPAGNIAFICRGWSGFVARYFTIQYSGTGALQWATPYSQTASDREPLDILVESTNRVVTAGWAINGTTTNYDYVLAGYTSTGAIAFQNTYSHTTPVTSSWDQLTDLTSDSQGNFIVTGRYAFDFYNEWLFKILTLKYGGIPVGIEEPVSANQHFAYVYPNPSSTGKFTLVDVAPSPLLSGKIFDIQGRFVANMDVTSDAIDLNHVAPGLYILVLERKDLPAENIRLVVQ